MCVSDQYCGMTVECPVISTLNLALALVCVFPRWSLDGGGERRKFCLCHQLYFLIFTGFKTFWISELEGGGPVSRGTISLGRLMSSLAWKAVCSHRGRFHLCEPVESDSPPPGGQSTDGVGSEPLP